MPKPEEVTHRKQPQYQQKTNEGTQQSFAEQRIWSRLHTMYIGSGGGSNGHGEPHTGGTDVTDGWCHGQGR
jgi:hypothetical protein